MLKVLKFPHTQSLNITILVFILDLVNLTYLKQIKFLLNTIKNATNTLRKLKDNFLNINILLTIYLLKADQWIFENNLCSILPTNILQYAYQDMI